MNKNTMPLSSADAAARDSIGGSGGSGRNGKTLLVEHYHQFPYTSLYTLCPHCHTSRNNSCLSGSGSLPPRGGLPNWLSIPTRRHDGSLRAEPTRTKTTSTIATPNLDGQRALQRPRRPATNGLGFWKAARPAASSPLSPRAAPAPSRGFELRDPVNPKDLLLRCGDVHPNPGPARDSQRPVCPPTTGTSMFNTSTNQLCLPPPPTTLSVSFRRTLAPGKLIKPKLKTFSPVITRIWCYCRRRTYDPASR